MIEKYTTLTLNGKFHSRNDLLRLVDAYSSEFAVAGWEKKFFGFLGEWLSEDPAIEVQTSGSTGNPGIFLAHKAKMVESSLRTGKFLGLSAGDTALLALPVSFIAGKMMVVRSFVLGLNLVPVNPTANPLADLDQPFDFVALTPMQLHHALQSNDGIRKINQIRKLIIGGGDISPVLMEQIRKLETDIWHTYGMAETLTHVALKKLTGENATEHFKALPGISFEQDERHCLVISAPWLSSKKIMTHDIVGLLDDQTFDFIGRFDNIINSGGFKISPEKVEARLNTILSQRFIVIGLPDVALGQKLVLVIEGSHISGVELMDQIKASGLKKHEVPREIHFLYQFPLTDSGKVIRPLVKEHILNK
ncbi:MAG: AMP-binding protein [Bacteroidetes bacterium]|nr:AMP-binding protein [Bacteroidota bacterium]